MKTRFVAATMLALAMLFGQSAGTVLAAMCPHLRSLHNACHTRAEVASAEHDAMNHSMAGSDSGAAKGDAFETNDASAMCTHCVVHSRNKRDESLLQQPNVAPRTDSLTTSTPLSIAALRPRPAATWTAKAHGPPGNNSPLHILLNVFRI